jgi:hypothetical protein
VVVDADVGEGASLLMSLSVLEFETLLHGSNINLRLLTTGGFSVISCHRRLLLTDLGYLYMACLVGECG